MILVTGATGNVGSELVRQLQESGESQRVVTRDEKKVAHLDNSIERVIGDISDPETAERAVRGVVKLFMFPLITEKHETNRILLDKAKKAGVKHVVLLSSMGAKDLSSKIGELHKEKEQLVEESGIPYTFLRPGAFMSNAFQWQATIRAQGKVYSPTGSGRVAPISPADIAAAAAAALKDNSHQGKIYLLTGPELLTTSEQVEILSRALGKQLECVDIAPDAAADRLRTTGAPAFLIDGLSKLWQSVKDGKAEFTSGDLEKMTGNKGRRFEDWCNEHRQAFLN